MSDEVEIRLATPADLPALGRLGALLVRVHAGFDAARFMSPSSGLEEGYGWFLGTQLGEPDVVIYVAVRAHQDHQDHQAHQILGYVYAGLEPQSWKELREAAGFVHDVVVAPEARGQGIAGRLVDTAAAWLEARGAPRVMLWTAEKNGSAHRLFERLGFRRTMVEMTRERRETP